MTDLNVPEQLYQYMVGGHRRTHTGINREKHKSPSYQIKVTFFNSVKPAVSVVVFFIWTIQSTNNFYWFNILTNFVLCTKFWHKLKVLFHIHIHNFFYILPVMCMAIWYSELVLKRCSSTVLLILFFKKSDISALFKFSKPIVDTRTWIVHLGSHTCLAATSVQTQLNL